MAFYDTASFANMTAVYTDVISKAVANGWIENIADEDYTGAYQTCRRVQLQGPGWGVDNRVHFQMRTSIHPASNNHWIQSRPVFGYSAGLGDFDSQVFKGLSTSWAVIAGTSGTTRRWLSITDTRIVLVTETNGFYSLMYNGFLLTFQDQDQWANPLMCAGRIHNIINEISTNSIQYDNINYYNPPFTTASNAVLENCYWVDSTGTVRDNAGLVMTLNSTAFTGRYPTDGTPNIYPLYPVEVAEFVSPSYKGTSFVYDGIYKLPGLGLTNESTITPPSGADLTVFPKSSAFGENNFFAMEHL